MQILRLNQDLSDIKDHFPNQKLTRLPMRDPLMYLFLCQNLFALCSKLFSAISGAGLPLPITAE